MKTVKVQQPKRTQYLNIRLSKEEADKLLALANKAERSVADYLRRLIEREARLDTSLAAKESA